jgi:hypothetical protein
MSNDDDKYPSDFSPNQARGYRKLSLDVSPAWHRADITGTREGAAQRMGGRAPRHRPSHRRGHAREPIVSDRQPVN